MVVGGLNSFVVTLHFMFVVFFFCEVISHDAWLVAITRSTAPAFDSLMSTLNRGAQIVPYCHCSPGAMRINISLCGIIIFFVLDENWDSPRKAVLL